MVEGVEQHPQPVAVKAAFPLMSMPIETTLSWFLAEGEGFEPPVGCPTTVFKTAALNRSANPPIYHSNSFSFGQAKAYPSPAQAAGAPNPVRSTTLHSGR